MFPEIIELRPHHITSIRDWMGVEDNEELKDFHYKQFARDYSQTFSDNHRRLMATLFNNPDQKVTIVPGIDTLCNVCPNKKDTCDIYDGKMILNILEKYGLDVNKTYSAQDIIDAMRS